MTLRIVQLTDLHLGPRPDDARWSALGRLLDELPTLTGGFDRLVLTGDLAAHGQLAVYQALQHTPRALAAESASRPGQPRPARALVREVFADRMLEGAPATNFLEDLGGVRLVGLDKLATVARQRNPGTYTARLALERAGCERFPRWSSCIIRPSALAPWWLDKDRLRDRSAFLQSLHDRGVQGVFCAARASRVRGTPRRDPHVDDSFHGVSIQAGVTHPAHRAQGCGLSGHRSHERSREHLRGSSGQLSTRVSAGLESTSKTQRGASRSRDDREAGHSYRFALSRTCLEL